MSHWLQRLVAWLKQFFAAIRRLLTASPAPPLPTPTQGSRNDDRTRSLLTASPRPLSPAQPQLPVVPDDPPEYRKRRSLFTYQEQRFFYSVLLQVVDERRFQIFSKVRMGDLVWIANKPASRGFYNSQIWCRHVDFVLCAKRSYEPMLVIELDDRGHTQYDRRASDDLKNLVFEEANLPLLRVPVQQAYDLKAIGEAIQAMLDKPADE